MTRQEKIDKLVSYEETYLSSQVTEYRQRLEQKTDKEIDEEYRKEVKE